MSQREYIKPKTRAEMSRAHRLVGEAVNRGVLIKPETCDLCGEKKTIIGHHHDYSKPLDVQWLCKSCHWGEHDRVGFSGFKSGTQIRLWPKNIEGLERMVAESNGMLSVGKLANFAVAAYILALKKNKPKKP